MLAALASILQLTAPPPAAAVAQVVAGNLNACALGPVASTTAASSPSSDTVYDTSASTGKGQITLGGSTASNPIGWWINVPASAYAGSYTSTVIPTLVAAP